MRIEEINLEPLTKEELIGVEGGDPASYDAGYLVGYAWTEFKESMSSWGAYMYATGSAGGAK